MTRRELLATASLYVSIPAANLRRCTPEPHSRSVTVYSSEWYPEVAPTCALYWTSDRPPDSLGVDGDIAAVPVHPVEPPELLSPYLTETEVWYRKIDGRWEVAP